MESNIKLQLKDLTILYKNGDGVRNINLDVKKGELVTLLGPSGCGKTTILRSIGGFLKNQAGEVLIDGKNIAGLAPEKRPTSMVFQSYNLWPHMTVFENMALGLKLRKVPKAQRAERIANMLRLVHMEGFEKKYPGQMSGGQQQRIAIGRSLLIEPDVLLLDEPFSALDAKIRSQMREELRKIQLELGITVVFVTHDQEEAMALSDRIVVMNKGCFEQVGEPLEIYNHPQTRYVADFIGAMNFVQQADGTTLAVRPEHLVFTDKEDADFHGIIRNIMMLGHYMEITVDSQQGVLRVFLTAEKAKEYQRGDHVRLEVNFSNEYKV